MKNEEKVSFRLRGLYQSYGYQQFRMSKFEEYDLYVRNKSFLLSDNIITFTDTNGKLMALKPDVTLSIVKNTRDCPGSIRKVYYNENVYRPARGSRCFREIMQVGLECIGDVDTYCITEVLSLAAKSLGAIAEDYVLDVSDLDILSCVLDRIGCTEETLAQALSFISERNLHDLRKVLAEAGIAENDAAPLFALLGCGPTAEDVRKTLSPLYTDDEWQKKVDAFVSVLCVLPAAHVHADFSVIHDANYYNGIVFGGFVRGIPNSILSGGQYDRLMRRMGRGESAIGFAVYLDQLELLERNPGEYDADVLLLYDEKTDIRQVLAAADEIAESGRTVLAERKIPDKMRFREIRRFEG